MRIHPENRGTDRRLAVSEVGGGPNANFRNDVCVVQDLLDGLIGPNGAYGGDEFTRIAAGQGVRVISIDSDPGAIEISYREVARNRDAMMYPIVADVSNPSPASGWGNTERMSLLDRGPTDAVIALALVHHLAITNNVPLEKIAEFFGSLGQSLIVEYVPRKDPKVQRLLSLRNHSFPGYNREGFEKAFGRYFSPERAAPIANSGRRLYLMSRPVST